MVTNLLALREMQPLLLAAILLTACAVKLARVVRHRSIMILLGPTALFPPRLRLPSIMVLCFTEMSLGVSLLVTDGHGMGMGRANTARLVTALFFLTGMCVLVELRERRPDLGCGCFGDLSDQPPGARSIIRTGMLAGAALSGLHVPPYQLPPPGPQATSELGLLAAELLALALVSPEVGGLLTRLGYSEPCQVRSQPPEQALAALRKSRNWRSHAHLITGGPADMWRELCWWYVVYPARSGGSDYEVVFAIEVKRRRPAIHAAMVGLAPEQPRAPVPDRPPEQLPGLYPAPAQVPSAIF
jgi:hypothetical protein